MSSINATVDIKRKISRVLTAIYSAVYCQIDDVEEVETADSDAADPHRTYIIYIVGYSLTLQKDDLFVDTVSGEKYQLVGDGRATGTQYYEVRVEQYRGN